MKRLDCLINGVLRNTSMLAKSSNGANLLGVSSSLLPNVPLSSVLIIPGLRSMQPNNGSSFIMANQSRNYHMALVNTYSKHPSEPQGEEEEEDAYLDRVAQELDIKWTSYFKARLANVPHQRKSSDRLRVSKQIFVTKEEELGVDHLTKPINLEIPSEFTHYKLIRLSDGAMLNENIERSDAEEIALNEGLDLILVADVVSPPIVKLGDYVVFLKHAIIKDKLSSLKDLEKELEEKKTKEIRFSATIDDHDLDVKMKKLIKFLIQGKKVKVLCFRVENEEEAFKLLRDFMAKTKSKLADEFPGFDLKKILEEEKPSKQKNEYMLNVKMKDDFVAKLKKAQAKEQKQNN